MTNTLGSVRHHIFQQLFAETREAANVTQGELARRLGVPRTAITRIELGERRVDIVELQTVCEVFGIPLLEFVRRYEELTQNIPNRKE